jgi:hypothetical protein
MIIRTKTPYSGKGKIWMKFVEGKKGWERFFNVTFQGMEGGEFLYEIDDDFPKKVLKLIFGYETKIVKTLDGV